jgi:hypothetical protein
VHTLWDVLTGGINPALYRPPFPRSVTPIMKVSQKTISFSGKKALGSRNFTSENPSLETVRIWAHLESRSPLRSFNPPHAGNWQKSSCEKPFIFAFCWYIRICRTLQDVADNAGRGRFFRFSQRISQRTDVSDMWRPGFSDRGMIDKGSGFYLLHQPKI